MSTLPKNRDKKQMAEKLMRLLDIYVEQFVGRVCVKPGPQEKAMDVFIELNNKWLGNCRAAKQPTLAKLFHERISMLSDVTTRLHRRKRIELWVGWAVWIGLAVLAFIGIGKFCEWTLEWFYPL